MTTCAKSILRRRVERDAQQSRSGGEGDRLSPCGIRTSSTPLEAAIVIPNDLVEIILGIDCFAVAVLQRGTQDVPLVDADIRGGSVE